MDAWGKRNLLVHLHTPGHPFSLFRVPSPCLSAQVIFSFPAYSSHTFTTKPLLTSPFQRELSFFWVLDTVTFRRPLTDSGICYLTSQWEILSRGKKKIISPRPLVSSPVLSTIWNTTACVRVTVCVCWHGNIMCIIRVGDPGVIHLEQNKLIYDIFQHVQCLWNIEISKKQNSSKTGWRADILSLPAGLPFPPAHLPIYRMETFRERILNSCCERPHRLPHIC